MGMYHEGAELILVPISRLAWGSYNHENERQQGQGDINAAYSGDKICNGKAKTFKHNGELWTTVGMGGRGQDGYGEAEAYRLTPLKLWKGASTTYGEKGRPDGFETARNDPSGFYDGMRVKHGKDEYVITGPAVFFRADPSLADAPQSGGMLFESDDEDEIDDRDPEEWEDVDHDPDCEECGETPCVCGCPDCGEQECTCPEPEPEAEALLDFPEDDGLAAGKAKDSTPTAMASQMSLF
jgi:hypothetical protein